MIAVVGIPGSGGQVHLGDTGVSQGAPQVNSIVILSGNHLQLGLCVDPFILGPPRPWRVSRGNEGAPESPDTQRTGEGQTVLLDLGILPSLLVSENCGEGRVEIVSVGEVSRQAKAGLFQGNAERTGEVRSGKTIARRGIRDRLASPDREERLASCREILDSSDHRITQAIDDYSEIGILERVVSERVGEGVENDDGGGPPVPSVYAPDRVEIETLLSIPCDLRVQDQGRALSIDRGKDDGELAVDHVAISRASTSSRVSESKSSPSSRDRTT